MTNVFPIREVGRVRSPVLKQKTSGSRAGICEIYIKPEFVPGLVGLEGYSHLHILYWDSWVEHPKLKLVPPGKHDLPEVGIFACRSPFRPNPIGLAICELIRCDGERLTLKGLSVIDGTPILDIKPYTPPLDAVQNPRYPEWVDKAEY